MDIDRIGSFFIAELLTGLSVSATIIGIGFTLERRDAPFLERARARLFNILYLFPASLLQHLLMPVGAAAAVIIGGTAGGLIALPSTGWATLPAVLAYLLAMDMGEYLFHRAQHRIPFLWSMHSFHHSDPELNISTTTRHFWLEHLIKSITVYLAVGMIFKVGAVVAASYALLTVYNYFAHMNVRVGFGRFSWVLNSPQFHRVHHSRLPQDHDCNFAGLLPLFDCLFGTYRRPDPGAFPPTGLDTGEVPGGLLEALAWPVRRMAPVRIPRSTAH
jgi:sterol desaturase/sphingolipid hydroxylase (fatty acid hydroxylase superfamily)